MRKRFNKAVEEASELRALFVLIVVYALKIYRIIPTLRPVQILIPATIAQIIIFIIAALRMEQFLSTVTIGNLIIVAIALIPSTFPRPIKAHWVRS